METWHLFFQPISEQVDTQRDESTSLQSRKHEASFIILTGRDGEGRVCFCLYLFEVASL